jgi:hypothetical protein
VKLDLLAQLALETDAVTIADYEHLKHEFGINRRSADLTVERLQFLAKVSQHARHNRIDPPQEMARRNTPFEVEQIECTTLGAAAAKRRRRAAATFAFVPFGSWTSARLGTGAGGTATASVRTASGLLPVPIEPAMDERR